MNLAELKQRERMTPVHIRLPVRIRETAKEIARQQEVNESDVYRTLIEKHLPEMATKRSHNQIQDVGKGGEPS